MVRVREIMIPTIGGLVAATVLFAIAPSNLGAARQAKWGYQLGQDVEKRIQEQTPGTDIKTYLETVTPN